MRPTHVLLLAALAFVPATTHAAASAQPGSAPLFGPEQAVTLSAISSPTWSRDGSRLAFVVSAPDTAENTTNQDLWLWEAATGTSRRLTRHAKNDYAPAFSPGGDTLAFVSAREGDKPRIWLLPLAGGDPIPLGAFPEAVGEIAWSPDGTVIAFTMLDSFPPAVKARRDRKVDAVVEDEELQWNHLWALDPASGRRTRLTSGSFNVAAPRWSPDGRRIAFLSRPSNRADDVQQSDVAIVGATGGTVRRLGSFGSGDHAWSPDSRWLAWTAGRDRDVHVAKSELWVAGAGSGAPRSLTAAFDEDAQTPAWGAGSDTLYFHALHGVSTRVAAVALAGGAVRLGEDRRAEAGDLVAGPGMRVAWIQSQPTAPVELWIAPHANAPGRAGSAVNAALATCRFGETRVVEWTSDDGQRIEGVVVRPWGAPPGARLKTLVLTHGGPYAVRDGLGFKTWARVFASRGWQVFMPNFRSSGGYGTAFMLRRRADWGGQDWRDVVTGIDTLIARGLADPARLAKAGHSYGGYLTAWAITQTPRFKAAIVSAGAVDLPGLWAQSDIHRYRAFEFEGPPWESFELWRRSSPIAHVRNVRTPTLVAIGRDDPRIPHPQAQILYQSLRALGVPTAMVSFPREGHGIREPRHRLDKFQRELDWLDRWVR